MVVRALCWILGALLAVASSAGASPALDPAPRLQAPGPDGALDDDAFDPDEPRLLVLVFGFEVVWGQLHPGGDALAETYEAYGYEETLDALMNFNVLAELLFAVVEDFEFGGHVAYDGLLPQTADHEVDLSAVEVGAVLRYRIPAVRFLAPGFRLEAGVLFADFEVALKSDTYTTPYVRPAFCLGSAAGASGMELTLGWTYAQAADGLGPGEALPLGGLDFGVLVRFAP